MRAATPTTTTTPLAILAFTALVAGTGGVRCSPSSDMLINVPRAGDAMLLTQPTYEYSPDGPGTLKYIYRWQHDRRDGEYDLGLTSDELKFDNHPPLDWEKVIATPSEPPAPVGKSEERIVNYAMLIAQQRQFHDALLHDGDAAAAAAGAGAMTEAADKVATE